MATVESEAFRQLIEASDVANRQFNALPSDFEDTNPDDYEVEERRMIAACHNADRAYPTNWAEFLRLFDHMSYNGGASVDEDNARRLIEHGRRLLAAHQSEGA